MKKIKNIIFDLGGVLFPISGQTTLNEFANNGVKDVLGKYKLLIDNDLFYNFETGKVSNEVFRKGINELFEVQLSDRIFDHCWNSMIVSYSEKNNPFLEKLKAKGYNLYILSNTNAIHVEYLEPMAKWREGLFTKKYYSQQIHLRKPDRECFEYVIRDAEINPEETLFIDDRPENIAGAESCGIKTINLTDINDLYERVEEFLK